jgi:hypothetical protein
MRAAWCWLPYNVGMAVNNDSQHALTHGCERTHRAGNTGTRSSREWGRAASQSGSGNNRVCGARGIAGECFQPPLAPGRHPLCVRLA